MLLPHGIWKQVVWVKTNQPGIVWTILGVNDEALSVFNKTLGNLDRIVETTFKFNKKLTASGKYSNLLTALKLLYYLYIISRYILCSKNWRRLTQETLLMQTHLSRVLTSAFTIIPTITAYRLRQELQYPTTHTLSIIGLPLKISLLVRLFFDKWPLVQTISLPVYIWHWSVNILLLNSPLNLRYHRIV